MNPVFTNYGFEILFKESYASMVSDRKKWPNIQKWMHQNGIFEKTKSVLDVGCGDGTFLSKLPADFKKYGVDGDLPAILRGREKFSELTLLHSDLENFHLSETFDLITMFHTLEHLKEPANILNRLHKIASESTLLIIEVPILEKAFSQDIVQDIVGMFTPLHLTHFSRNTFAAMLAVSGWEIRGIFIQDGHNGCRIIAKKSQKTDLHNPNLEDVLSVKNILHRLFSQHAAVEKRIASLPEKIKHVVIWGGGGHTEVLYHVTSLFHDARKRKFVIVDSDLLKQGKTWRGVNCYRPDTLKFIDWNTSILIISSYGSMVSIYKMAVDLGVPKEKIVTLYDAPWTTIA
jgi:2-polyprenyl-3-methyl-5-hydroxy-6-metoxy-1,4-benzoquinol methylase